MDVNPSPKTDQAPEDEPIEVPPLLGGAKNQTCKSSNLTTEWAAS